MKRLLSLAPALVAIVFPFISVQACGPFFFDDVFVRPLRPDHPKEFAAGKLGVLLPTYPRADLAVAYRYLSGGTLTPEEQKAYVPTESYRESVFRSESEDAGTPEARYAERLGPADTWLNARDRYAAPQPEIHSVREYGEIWPRGMYLAGSYQNCQADAFRTAVATLQSRANTWGAKSAELADWIKGQDAVFSNCGGGGQYMPGTTDKPVIHPASPAPAPLSAPLLLRQDRAYQIAAAQFYAAQFASARTSFQAITQDQSSPWRGIAAYLVARALVRDAFLSASGSGDEPLAGFNLDHMKEAQQQLETIRDQNLPGISRHAIQELLNLVRMRTQPDARLRELAAAIAGPKTDAFYTQDLNDLNWYLNAKLDSIPIRENVDDYLFHVDRPQSDYTPLTPEQKQPGFNKAFNDTAALRSTSSLIDWLITFQSPAEDARKHALKEWKRTHSTPWLLAALEKASASDPDAPSLIEAAGRIPSVSSAWLTATYHRERLLLGTGHITIAGVETEGIKAAAIETDALMNFIDKSGSESAANLFRGVRMRAASTLDDALADAPRGILERSSQQQSAINECIAVMKENPKRHYDCSDPKSSVEFSDDAADLFNHEMPLATLAQAAQSKVIPQRLRQSVAMMTWVRAVLLKNDSIAAQMLPLLPDKLRQQAGEGTGFHALTAILRNPGLRPYLDSGVQRNYSWDFVESYSDNWWCADRVADKAERDSVPYSAQAAFLTPEMRATAASESKQLHAFGGADQYLGSQVLAYANAHPSDPDVPESLYLTLRMIRYGCRDAWPANAEGSHADPISDIARETGAIMRRRYATNPWTKKAAPFVWPAKKAS